LGRERPISIVTPEQRPLALFGPAAATAIEALLSARGIVVHAGSRAALVRPGELVLAGGAELAADVVVTLPSLAGPRIAGIPTDGEGFIPVDAHGRVRGCDNVYAAGDATTFALKQGGLATQQGDAVAESIAAEVGAPVHAKPFHPVLRGLLMTGGAPLYLRAEPRSGWDDAGKTRWSTQAEPSIRRLSAAAGQPLWWPPAKIAGRYLAPFLATAHARPLTLTRLTDRAPVDGGMATDEVRDALELALTLADCDARWGDFASALEALDAAEALAGSLPPEYEAKRRAWSVARRRA
jgi:sulfide:quinone oxidoreductase